MWLTFFEKFSDVKSRYQTFRSQSWSRTLEKVSFSYNFNQVSVSVSDGRAPLYHWSF